MTRATHEDDVVGIALERARAAQRPLGPEPIDDGICRHPQQQRLPGLHRPWSHFDRGDHRPGVDVGTPRHRV